MKMFYLDIFFYKNIQDNIQDDFSFFMKFYSLKDINYTR